MCLAASKGQAHFHKHDLTLMENSTYAKSWHVQAAHKLLCPVDNFKTAKNPGEHLHKSVGYIMVRIVSRFTLQSFVIYLFIYFLYLVISIHYPCMRSSLGRNSFQTANCRFVVDGIKNLWCKS